MRRARILTFFGFMAAAVFAEGAIENLKSSVVLIEGAEEGAGVIVGADAETVFVATAAHVVPEATAKVRFLGAPGRQFTADVIQSETDADFAVLAVAVPSADTVRSSLKALAYRAGPVPIGTTVSNIGHPAGERWQINAGVNKVQGTGLLTLTLSNTGIAKGSSGGPLFDDKDRLIGVVLEKSAATAKAVKMDSISTLLQQWDVRANLLTETAATPENCVVAMRSTPSGATVFVGDEPKGVTPLSLSISQGSSVAVRLEKDGYIAQDLTADCSASSRTVTLKPDVCTVGIKSTPSGARVFVDGEGKGTTPMSLNVTQGSSHEVRLEKQGYAPEELTADCSTPNVSASLTPDTGSATLIYTGDRMGCNLQLSVTIGGKKYTPTSNSYVMNNIPLGSVNFSVSGQIFCSTGACQAGGSGTLDIEDGDEIYLGWVNTAYATCKVDLKEF